MGTIKMKDSVQMSEISSQIEAAPVAQAPQTAVAEPYEDPAVRAEDTAFTDAHARLYYCNNGTAKSIVGAEAVNYYDEDGKNWRKIDSTLVERDGVLENRCGGFKAAISKDVTRKSVTVGKNGRRVSWTYLGKQTDAPTVQTAVAAGVQADARLDQTLESCGNRAVYGNVEPQTDLEYCIQGSALKENIIVKEKSDSYRYLFALQTNGLKMRLSEDNTQIELYAGEKTEFTIPAPYMYDADGVASDEVYYELDPTDNEGYTFAVVGDPEWINAAERAFPVTIDPQIVTDGTDLIAKQVQYRYVYSSSGSGTGYGSWTNASSSYIRVQKDSSYEYQTKLTIKKSKMKMLANRVVSVKLILKPTSSFYGYLYVGGKSYYQSGSGTLTADITSTFKTYSGDFTVYVEPHNSYYINGSFYMTGTYAPTLEIEYLTNEKLKPCTREFSLAGNATAVFDVPTGEVSAMIPAASGDGLSLHYGIYHVYKRSGENHFCGRNLRLNLDEKLKKPTASLDADYVYTDPYGDKHGFQEKFYTLDAQNKRVAVNKSDVTVGLDGTLKNSAGREVFKEEVSDTGWRAVTKLVGVKGVDLYEQRQSEIKQLEDKITQYEDALKDFVLIDPQDGTIQNKASDYVSNETFQTFIDSISGNRIPLTTNEALAYSSLLLQKDSLQNQEETYEFQHDPSCKYQKLACDHQYQSLADSLKIAQREQEKKFADKIKIPFDSWSKEEQEEFIDINTQLTNLNNQMSDVLGQKTLLGGQDALNQAASSNTTAQILHVDEQLLALRNKRAMYTRQLKQYYKEYVNMSAELVLRKRFTPINYLTDGSIIKGFNEDGDLVVIGDGYQNTLAIERDNKGRILRVTDDKEKSVTFAYNYYDRLVSITDARGRMTCYTYDDGDTEYLRTVTYSDGSALTLTGTGQLDAVESKYERTALTYSGTRLKGLRHNSLFTAVKHGESTSGTTLLSQLGIEYADNRTKITDVETATVEMYEFDANGNACKYYVEAHGLVTKAEHYAYQKYAKDNTEYAKPSILHKTSLSAFSFAKEAYDYTTLDSFNLPSERTTFETLDTNTTRTTQTEYTYDENRRVVKEYATVTTSNSPKDKHAVKTVAYNDMGSVVRTESYVEEEVVGRGKTVEETVYDDKGRAVKSFTYNTLDTSSKYYNENELDENGKVVAEYDATGENKTLVETVEGTETVRTRTLRNGSKFAYGYDASERVTAITQSTAEGEENSTQTAYTGGLVTEVKSGNNTVRYSYDGKGRKTAVYLNDLQTPYVAYVYEKDTNGEKIAATLRNGDAVHTETDKKGNVLSVKYNNVTQMTASYDSKNRATQIVDGVTGNTVATVYDAFDRIDAVKINNVETESYAYNTDGNLSTKTVTVGDSTKRYEYGYKDNAAKDLDSITVDGVTVMPQSDCLGRNTGKRIAIGGTDIAEEHISYRKVGDHATNMPSAERYGEMRNGAFVLLDNRKYKYDACGNISEVWENGTLAAKYTYDALNRLIREDNKQRGNTTLYTYDNNGNILSKRAFAFTLKDTALLEEMPETQYMQCAYSGDKLLAFGNEHFEYDGMGNPTTYRDKACAWEKGRQLVSYDETTFAYDGQGRRIRKNTTQYTYDSNGNLLKQADGENTLEFLYDHSGLMGVKHNGNAYLYRKNIMGDVIAILDSTGKIVVRYVYDAWGNHEVKILDGTSEDKQATHIGNLNPFRYRGYYYDVETGLYFLKTRYYDSEVCRFITIDDIQYLDPEHINGLNLYAYCGDNPVMNIDPTGTEPITIMAIVAALLFSTFMGTMSGIAGAAINNRHIGIGAAIGAIGGLLNGVGLVLGVFVHPAISVAMAVTVGLATEYFNQLFNHEEIDIVSLLYSGLFAGLTGILSFAIGSGLESLTEIAMAYILTPVFFGLQTIFDSIVSIFNPIETIFNWFKKIFNFGGKKPVSASSGSGTVGGGFGGGGGSSW